MRFGDRSGAVPYWVGVDGTGGVVVGGTFGQSFKLPKNTSSVAFTAGGPSRQYSVMRCHTETGVFPIYYGDWGYSLDGVEPKALSTQSNGATLFAGRTDGTSALGEVVTDNTAFVWRVDGSGVQTWAQQLGGPTGSVTAATMNTAGEGFIAITTSSASIDVGTGDVLAGSGKTIVAELGK